MKLRYVAALAGAMLAGNAAAQSQAVFQNNSDLDPLGVPPQVAASVFINSAWFPVSAGEFPFDTLYTLFFTNKTSGRMEGYPGFRLDFSTNNTPATIVRYPAAVIHNQGKIYGSTRVELWATNIFSPGPISTGIDGLIKMRGQRVDLSRSILRAGGDPEYPEYDYSSGTAGTTYYNPRGVTDLYWGTGVDGRLSGTNGALLSLPTLQMSQFMLPYPNTPSHQTLQLSPFSRNRIMTNFASLPDYIGGSFGLYDAYAMSNRLSMTSSIIQMVLFPTNTLTAASGVGVEVRFLGSSGFGTATPAIQFRSPYYDPIDQVGRLQTFYLIDYAATLTTNFTLQTGMDSRTLVATGTRRPNTYETSLAEPYSWNYSALPNLAFSNVVFYSPDFLTNRSHYAYAAYAALLNATNDYLYSIPTYIPAAEPSNTYGRIEIEAGTLDLRQARMRAENYVSVTASNLIGNTLAAVDAPVVRYDIGTTQSVLRVSNLVATAFNRMYGQVAVWSALWTNYYTTSNLFTGNLETNELKYHMTFVDYYFQPSIPVQLYDFTARATNVVIDDSLTTTAALRVDAESLLVSARGGSNMALVLPPFAGWGATNFPRLKHLTNHGDIVIPAASEFLTWLPTNDINGQPVTLEMPYHNFINTGNITGATHTIYATNFQHSGSLVAVSGGINLRLTNGALAGGWLSARSDIEVRARDFTASGSTLSAGGSLLLDVTNHLADAGPGALNDWAVNDGFVMVRRPRTGDLLGTRITSQAGFNQLVHHIWAGQNRGATAAGFSNNAALGHLVLDGRDLSLFQFAGAGTNDALYVDYLEFVNYATNIATILQIAPNLTIYFANANLSADKLNGALGGRLRWVYHYTGPRSSTNLVVDGRVVTLNAALLQSMFSDLDGDGIPNKLDPTPLLSGRDLDLAVEIVRAPALQTRISWHAIRFSTSHVEYTTNLVGGPWLPLTTLTQGAANGRLTVLDPVRPGAPRYYRVRVEPFIGLIEP